MEIKDMSLIESLLRENRQFSKRSLLSEERTCLDWMNEICEILEQDFGVKITRQSTSRTKVLLTKPGYDPVKLSVKDFDYVIRVEDAKTSKKKSETKFRNISDAETFLEKHFA